MKTPETTLEICDALGRAKIAARIGCKVTAVSNCVTPNQFPAQWYVILEEMCREHDMTCPRKLFSFRREAA